MKGIELCEKFYLEYGEPMLRDSFGELFGLVATGIAGGGSECFGYDDEISRDHDFEAGFCIFLPSEDIVDRRAEFMLERAYSKLPREFMGINRSQLAPIGGSRHGVMRVSDFVRSKTGRDDGMLSLEEWFFVPEQSLAELTNGKIFSDPLGVLTEIRERFSYLPEDVRLKKLAGNLIIMEQAGRYNYQRCIARGARAAAQLAIGEFVRSALHTVFLIEKRYMPYYKWSFRALRDLPRFSSVYDDLEYLISSANRENDIVFKNEAIERTFEAVFSCLREDGFGQRQGQTTEAYADAINRAVKNSEIRNFDILYGV